MVDISGLDRADVLAALYNASRPQGLGFLYGDPKPMEADEARVLLAKDDYFDYLKGRVMKVSLSSDKEFNERLYDRDCGTGAAAAVVTELRAIAM
jgi:hypothetical protein